MTAPDLLEVNEEIVAGKYLYNIVILHMESSYDQTHPLTVYGLANGMGEMDTDVHVPFTTKSHHQGYGVVHNLITVSMESI
jgi:hypothetical protein